MEKEQYSESQDVGRIGRIWNELRRRKVIRVASAYFVTGWIIIQVASSTFSDFDIPVWAFRFVVMMVLLGFPLALILAWAFELTPEGIRSTKKAIDVRRDEDDPSNHRKRNWMAYAAGALLPTLIFGTLSIFFYLKTSPVIEGGGPEEGDVSQLSLDVEEISIAVLPLANMSPDPDNAFFAAGVHEDILTNLSKVRALKVVSRTSTIGYQDTTKKLTEIGEELGVRYLVEGSVRRSGDRVRVTVQLIDAKKDEHLWAENYDRTLDDIFAIQSAVAKEIAGQLKATIAPEEIARIDRRPTDNPEAYDYFLRFRQIQEDKGGSFGDEKIALLEKAIELDPEYAEAWAELSVECVYWWATDKNRNDPDLLAKGYRALAEAERLAPDQPFVPRAKASYARWVDQSAAGWEKYLEEALEKDPTYEFALTRLSGISYDNGDFERAETQARSLLELEPSDSLAYYRLINALLAQKKWDETILLVQEKIEREPASYWVGQFHLADLRYRKTGNETDYKNDIREVIEHLEDNWLKFYALKNLKEYVRALELGSRLYKEQDRMPDYFGIQSYELEEASIWYLIGDEKKVLEKAIVAEKGLHEILEEDPQSLDRIADDLILTYAYLGKRDKAESIAKEVQNTLSTLSSKFDYEYLLAEMYLVLGDSELAVEHLIRAVQIGKPFLPERWIKLSPFWEPIRDHPKIIELLQE